MKALVVEDTDRLRVVDVATPEPDGRAVVAVEWGGLCGTDVKVLSGAIPTRRPLVIGHEVIGTILRPGARKLFAEGTRVLLDPGAACGGCRQCRNDRPNLCPNGGLMGRDIDGGFAQRIVVDELRLHPVPDAVPADEAVVLQVLGTCVHAQTLVNVFPDDTAVVVGLGVSGLLHLQLLLARGVRTVVGITRSTWKRDLAMQLGATATAAPDEAADVLAELTGANGADLVVESAGTPATVAQSIELAGAGGTVLLFGILTASRLDAPLYQLYHKELDVVNARGARPRDYSSAIELVAGGAVKVRPLLSARYPLDDAPAAFDACANDPDLLKVLLQIG